MAAERAFLRRLEGGCQVPVAALAAVGEGGQIELRGRVVSLGGERAVDGVERQRASDEPDAERIGFRLAERLLAQGADSILAEVRAASAPAVPEP